MTGDYLWDRSGWPDPEIVRLERLLGRFAHEPRPLSGMASTRSGGRRFFGAVALATAASVAALVGTAWYVRSLPAASVEVRRLAGTPTVASRPLTDARALPVGQWLETDATARAAIDVGGAGRLEIEPDTRIGLLSRQPGDYQLHLQRGTMQAVIWSPPGEFSVKTPSATAVDLGCVYSMTVDDDGVGVVRVAVGWVGFEWKGRESFIPAGAVCVTRPGLGPGTPHFEETSAEFRRALETIDVPGAPGTTPAARAAAIDRVLAEATRRDAVTLWHLLSRVDGADRDRVFDRLASFVPAPADVTRDAIRAGRRDALDAWWDALDLGTSSWWRIWKQQWRDGATKR